MTIRFMHAFAKQSILRGAVDDLVRVMTEGKKDDDRIEADNGEFCTAKQLRDNFKLLPNLDLFIGDCVPKDIYGFMLMGVTASGMVVANSTQPVTALRGAVINIDEYRKRSNRE